MSKIVSFLHCNNPTFTMYLHTFLAIMLVSITKGDILANPTYDEGIDYKRIYSENKYKKTKKVEVVEFFGLFCPHCRNFSPVIQQWARNFLLM